MRVQLFTTLGCHLCEQALALLHALQREGFELVIEETEIAESETLMNAYGIRIPVIMLGDAEIGWPFSLDELREFTREHA